VQGKFSDHRKFERIVKAPEFNAYLKIDKDKMLANEK
jgi:hypothetical protein